MDGGTDTMRVLTVRQPWAWAIIHGGKDVENRVRNIAGGYRGLVAIHVGLRDDYNAFSDLDNPNHSALDLAVDQFFEELPPKQAERVPTPWWTQHGHIIGVVRLAEVHHSDSCWDAPDNPGLLCSDWADDTTIHLVMENPRPLASPIPFKGALGLRNLDPETIAAIEAQL